MSSLLQLRSSAVKLKCLFEFDTVDRPGEEGDFQESPLISTTQHKEDLVFYHVQLSKPNPDIISEWSLFFTQQKKISTF